MNRQMEMGTTIPASDLEWARSFRARGAWFRDPDGNDLGLRQD